MMPEKKTLEQVRFMPAVASALRELEHNQPKHFTAARGRCYEAAYLMLMEHKLNNTDRVVLCHGIAKQTRHPFAVMGHAWIEEQMADGKWYCRDGQYPNHPILRDRYYEGGTIDPANVVKYTRTDAKRRQQKTGNVGPWDEKIAAAAHGNDTPALSGEQA
jgi:hypothetical protein